MSDMEKLVENTRHGDLKAQAKLYRQCYPKAVNTCQRIVGDLSLSEEIADDAFLVAFSKLHQLEEGQRFEPWLCQITRRLALRHLRRSHGLPTVPLEEIADLPEEEITIPSEEEILQAIEGLPQGYRDVFKMYVLDGKSHLEIADRLGIHSHSSSSQLARAKRMLRKMLRYGWLILLLPLAWFTLYRQQAEPPFVAKNREDMETLLDTPTEPMEGPKGKTAPGHIGTTVEPHTPTAFIEHAHSDSCSSITDDTPAIVSPQPGTQVPMPTMQVNQPDLQLIASTSSRWSFNISYNMPTANGNNLMAPYTLTLANGNSIDNWHDFLIDPVGGSATDSIIANIAIANISNIANDNDGQILRASQHLVPIEFSLSASYRISRHWSIGIGMGLMQLQSEFTIGESSNCIEQTQQLYFLNLPIGIHYHFFPSRRLSLYTAASVSFLLPLSGTMTTDYILKGDKSLTERNRIDNAPVVSFAIGVGMQWNITPSIGIFAEPSLRYHCLSADAPVSFLSQNPFTFSLPCGLRITF